ncbi:hypothetical protein MOQ_002486 [Trypanosoma cruzi marinkellei]|uniref:Uncharacterized protein n=1 Tax=Trypanosoma cruzi marinkellei TaxID=85056 RepID=K2N6U6_TRYCR|nr:hypothetical protein MOQ_002486 [Trypanosoma cruzi marinkellei]
MGHNRENHAIPNYREVLLMQQRTTSFLIVFSVVAIAFFVLIVSIQTQEAICQTRAETAAFSVYAKMEVKNDSLSSALLDALNTNGVHAEPVEKRSKSMTRIDVFDTLERTLLNSGFRLLRQPDEFGVTWRLRYLEHSVCRTERKISMEALPNVDYEKVSYDVMAINTHGGRAFLYEAEVKTKDRDRITTFPQLQSLFPGFNARTASPQMVLTDSVEVLTAFAAELYYGSTSLDIELQMEERKREKGGKSYWRVTLLTKNILAESNLKGVHRIVSEVVQNRSLLCDPASCGSAFGDPFLQ